MRKIKAVLYWTPLIVVSLVLGAISFMLFVFPVILLILSIFVPR